MSVILRGCKINSSASVGGSISQQRRINRVKTMIANASFPSVMGSPPTINNLAVGAVTTISPSKFISIADVSSVKSYAVSQFAVKFTAALNDGIFRNFYSSSGSFYSGASAIVCSSFIHIGSEIDFLFGGTSAWQLLVDGQLIASSFQSETVSGSSAFIQQVIFPGSATRKITIISQNEIAGFFVGAGDTVQPADPFTGNLSIHFQGDSYSQQAGTNFPYGLAFEIAARLGCFNIWCDPVGGTGFIQENPGVNGGVNTNFTERFGLMTPTNPVPDIFVVLGGLNDPDTLTQANVRAHITKARVTYPDSIFAYVGPFCPVGSQATDLGQKFSGIRDTIKSAVATDAGPNTFTDSLLGVWYNSSGKSGSAIIPALQGPAGFTGGQWQTGDGHVGATTGKGNGDTWVSSDATHPTATGTDGLAQLIAAAQKSAIAAL